MTKASLTFNMNVEGVKESDIVRYVTNKVFSLQNYLRAVIDISTDGGGQVVSIATVTAAGGRSGSCPSSSRLASVPPIGEGCRVGRSAPFSLKESLSTFLKMCPPFWGHTLNQKLG